MNVNESYRDFDFFNGTVKATIVATIQHFVGGLIWDGFGKVCKRLLYIKEWMFGILLLNEL
jgi:hypothetical protein